MLWCLCGITRVSHVFVKLFKTVFGMQIHTTTVTFNFCSFSVTRDTTNCTIAVRVDPNNYMTRLGRFKYRVIQFSYNM